MPDVLIACGGQSAAPGPSTRVLELDLSADAEEQRAIRFDPGSISAPLLDNLPDELADALEIAAYVYSADRLIRRGSDESGGIADEWQRRLRFRIPVRKTDLWRNAKVKDALVEALTFLSGDIIEVEFTKARVPAWAERYLGFNDAAAQTIRPDEIILFSGGLDSLAGVAEGVLGANCNAVLVTHQSANIIASKQRQLAKEIERRTGRDQTLFAPVWVRRGRENEPLEHSQRLRSFLFATLGVTYAHMFGCSRVAFYENGITSFNLPLAQHVVGTRASRTTHPGVLARFQRLFSLILSEATIFANPFLWKTKTDIVKMIATNGLDDLIGMTTSCARVRNLSMSGQQCGSCSQCVERRYAILAADLDHREPAGTYQCDPFLGAHQDGRDLTLVETHALRAHKLATMSEQAFLSNFGQVFRAVSDMDGPADQTARRIYELHRRYGNEVRQVLDRQLQRYSSFEAILDLPETSLLGLIRSAPAKWGSFVDPSEREPELPTPTTRVAPRRILFAVDQRGKRVGFDDGPTFGKKSAALLLRLIEQFAADFEAQRDAKNYVFISTKALLDLIGGDDVALRQRVRRIRLKLECTFENNTGYRLDTDDVIQSINWTGYRLNPNLVMVSWRQLHQAPSSRLSGNNVTTLSQQPVNQGSLSD